MKVPKKIYIQAFNPNKEDSKFERLLYFDDVWTEEPELGQENIEYTRTDTFIEKAEAWLIKNQKGFILTDKDITDFKYFMKGEIMVWR